MTPYLKKSTLFPPLIKQAPAKDLGMIVVIPAFKETALIQSLESLKNCALPRVAVEVIVVINDSEKAAKAIFEFHKESYQAAQDWALANSSEELSFFILYQSKLPAKHAGVGLARKIGMDEAVYRLESVENPNGIILCYDADSTCQKNYLQEVERYFAGHPKIPAASIHYEHPLAGDAFGMEIYEAIIAYELHLRYYIEIQRWAGFPFAYHTVGSSMAVRANAYQAQGGMNRRKAGEDFYFLHKFISLGNFGEINTTKVIPSPRTSDRVPFGTGKSVQDILTHQETYTTYAPATFADLKLFLKEVPTFYYKEKLERLYPTFPASIQQFLEQQDFEKKMQEIRDNIGSKDQFVNRFYRWFNAFLLMKYVHFTRDHFYPNVAVGEAAHQFLLERKVIKEQKSQLEYLTLLRKMQRQQEWSLAENPYS